MRRRSRLAVAAISVVLAAWLGGGTGAAVGGAASDPTPALTAPVLVPMATDETSQTGPEVGAALDPAVVTRTLDPLLRGGALGSTRAAARIIDLATGTVVYAAGDRPTAPASTMKLITAVSALDALGPQAVLATRAVIADPTSTIPRVTVVGGGDPSLTSTAGSIGGAGTSLPTASMRDLAESTAQSLRVRGVDTVRIGYDSSLFTGAALHPSWDGSFPGLGIVAPVSALVVDQGRVTPTSVARSADPAAAAGQVFADQLRAHGITVRGEPRAVETTTESVALAEVNSPPVGALVERMLGTSDNDFAEILARRAALAAGEPGSFSGVGARAEAVLGQYGIDVSADRFADGSGLSRDNALTPTTLIEVLRVAGTRFGDISSGLPVGGATGSLAARFTSAATEPASGLVRAKTGTLTGVVGLAGYLSRPDGRLLAFAILDDSAPGGALASRDQIDRALSALVTCDCAAG